MLEAILEDAWAPGFSACHITSGMIHALPVIAIVVFIVRIRV